MQCEKEFKKLDCQTNYVKKVEPLKYTCQLLLGILCLILSLSFLLAIALEVIQNTIYKIKTKDFLNANPTATDDISEDGTETKADVDAQIAIAKNIQNSVDLF